MFNLIRAGRPHFLLLGLTLFLFGAQLAVLSGAPFSPARFLLGYLMVLPAQLSVHYSNEYFDSETDALAGVTPLSGGSGILLAHPELKPLAKRISVALIVCSLGMGLLFLRMYGYPIWFFCLLAAGNLAGWCYSAPPARLSARGLGEFVTVFCGGFLVPMTGYLAMKGTLDQTAALFVLPLLLYGLVLILSVETPDMEVDRVGGKLTWIVRKGRGFGFTLAGISLLAATAYFFLLHWVSPLSPPLDFRVLGLLSLIALGPGMYGLMKRPSRREPATKAAVWTLLGLGVFSIAADGYLLFLLVV